MTAALAPDETLVTTTGDLLRVRRLLGEGGQGWVYEAETGDEPVALKWYKARWATDEQRASLEELIDVGRPARHFLWPTALAEASDGTGLGYVMPLRDERYRPMYELLRDSGRAGVDFRCLTTIGIEIAHAFLQLHAEGLCYRDLNFGNVFFDPTNGDVLVCDNDNVGIDNRRSGVLGVWRFMAPEVVRRDAMPSCQTDRHSLAVLLFYLLMVGHPLEGRAVFAYDSMPEQEAMLQWIGQHPVYIFDPDDESNRPDPIEHAAVLAYRHIYPQSVRDRFERAFTEGLHDPGGGRVPVGEWRSALAALRDTIMVCQHCGRQNFADSDRAPQCWSCQRDLHRPPHLLLPVGPVMLNADTRLYGHHLASRPFDFDVALAKVSPNPTDQRVWGLTNLSGDEWIARRPGDEAESVIAPGRTVRLEEGLALRFGGSWGTVHA